MRRSLSLRTRFILVVLVLAVVPLALVGWWLTSSTMRSGERLLRARLRGQLERSATAISTRWFYMRNGVLAIAEHPSLRQELADGTRVPSNDLRQLFTSSDSTISAVTLRDAGGRDLWTMSRDPIAPDDPASIQPIQVEVPVFEGMSAKRAGTLIVAIASDALLPENGDRDAPESIIMALVDPRSNAVHTSLPFDVSVLDAPRFSWLGESWVREERLVAEPRVRLYAAAPLTAYTAPFARATRQGLLVLIATAAAGMIAVAATTTRMTNALRRLASAAEGVAAGDLERKVNVSGTDDIARVATAFNVMTDSLRRTVGELSQRETLATVGRLASELAHEVRNPLTSIRVDLQYVEEQLPPGSPLREIQQGAVEEISRIDATVAGVLQLARSGSLALRSVDAMDAVRGAIRAIQPEIVRHHCTLQATSPAGSVIVSGDVDALRQVLFNLLQNATQASPPGSTIELATRCEGARAVFEIRDNGSGIDAGMIDTIRQPFVTTKPGGTGLGLAMVERVIAAHGGSFEITSSPLGGTIATFSLRIVTD